MFKFGKKVTYRPLAISLLLAVFTGTIAQSIINNTLLTIFVGFCFFFAVFIIYYFPNVPLLFSYWESNKDVIRYVDTANKGYRLLSMFFPFANHLTTINKSDIKKISIIGNVNQNFEAPMAIPYTAAVGISYAAIAMVHNPDYVRLTLQNGQTVDLSIRRDYTYSRTKTLEKLTKFFDSLKDTDIQVELPKIN